MEINPGGLIQNLQASEIATLLQLYYNKDRVAKGEDESNFNEEILHSLLDKNLVTTSLISGESIISLTEEGLSLCGSIMLDRIQNKDLEFKTEMQLIPHRIVSCLVKRVMWKDTVTKESGQIDEITKPYALDESIWYERVLLNDERMRLSLNKLYNILEDFDFIKTTNGEQWCSPEVENYLKDQYKDVMDLSWTEEDSLKYYYFFYVYANDQKNLIDFTGDGEQIRSVFFNENSNTSDFWLSINKSDPHTFISSLGVGEKRVFDFLEEMRNLEIVSERHYPMSSFSSFGTDDKIFIINDIKSYMEYIAKKFLTPVVDSLIA